MIVKLQTEHNLDFLSLKEGCIGSSQSTLVKMSNCWKSPHGSYFCIYAGLMTHPLCTMMKQEMAW